ncbi:uncharacterized protein LOC112572284 [Pomacea canaliculata]|uniref:uncharacterized protein LOC112572284 n=1 Tax=Pomacea canaliculata TaxID=400727 RepID=UPI000D7366EF|nr:uncharacterized protein LOC112572284 [Pomacea canaliculata]
MLGPAVLGDCSPHQRVAYTAMSKVLNIPCHRYKQEYLMSSTCWKSTDLTEMVRNCFLINAGKISTNFCSGGQVIRTCIISDIKMLPGCDISSQRILDIMVTTWYNTVGIVLQPTCPELAVSSLTKTTSVANSEGWTSQAGQHEESTSSGDNLQPPSTTGAPPHCVSTICPENNDHTTCQIALSR